MKWESISIQDMFTDCMKTLAQVALRKTTTTFLSQPQALLRGTQQQVGPSQQAPWSANTNNAQLRWRWWWFFGDVRQLVSWHQSKRQHQTESWKFFSGVEKNLCAGSVPLKWQTRMPGPNFPHNYHILENPAQLRICVDSSGRENVAQPKGSTMGSWLDKKARLS